MTDNVPDSLSATEQSICILSPASKITLEPDKTSNELPVGIVTSLTNNDVPFWTLFAPPLFDVVLTSSTSVVTATDSTERSTTSTTFVTASNTLSVNITPSSSSSKILVTVSTCTYANGGVDGLLTVYRDSTDLGNSNRGFQANGGDDAHIVGSTFSVLDSPSTTSQITYQPYIHGSSSYAMKMNYGGSKATIIAMEIGA